MYPLIVLILLASVVINAFLSRWEQRLLVAAGHAMNARWRRVRNALVLIAALVALWQGLYWWVGDVALASPLATLRYTAKLVASESFDTHLFDTLRAFAIAFALSVVIGLAGRVLAGLRPALGRHARADDRLGLRDSEAHAVPDPAAGVRARRCRPRSRSACCTA